MKLTYKKTRKIAEQVVADRGEGFVYHGPDFSGCVYVEHVDQHSVDLAPSCLVGHILYRAGVPLETLLTFNESIISEAETYLHDAKLDLTPKALHFLETVQQEQDDTKPWGQALRAGIETIEQ